MKNARFWVWHNGGWVKLTLRFGQTVELFNYGRTDEGWYRERTKFHHDGENVVQHWHQESRDCDGRFEQGGECSCPLDKLTAKDMFEAMDCSENKGIYSPDWQKGYPWQRDHSAEAAGY